MKCIYHRRPLLPSTKYVPDRASGSWWEVRVAKCYARDCHIERHLEERLLTPQEAAALGKPVRGDQRSLAESN
jgi:hypothetical protein